MAITISAAYVQTYERTVRQLAQQSETRLRQFVTEKGVVGDKHNWDRLGKGDFTTKAAARTATPATDSPWSRRTSITGTKHDGDTVEPEDIVQMLIDPKSSVAEKQGMGAKRAVDDIIIAAATGNSMDGTGAAVTFPAGQKIGTGAEVMSFDLVTAVQEKFMQNDIDPSIPKVFVVGPTQVRKLMQLTEQTSADYVNREALQKLNSTGIVPNWMGFTWVVSTRLLVPAGGQISALAFTKRAIGLQVSKDIWSRVAEDPSISFAWRIYTALTMGATRVEDEQIVHVHLKNSLT